MIPIKIVGKDGASAVVEWVNVRSGELNRTILPYNLVDDGFAKARDLSLGIVYGEPWENVELVATSEQLAKNLRQAGIWTALDLRKNPNGALGAIMTTYGVDFQILLKLAEQGLKKQAKAEGGTNYG